jgi:hypothetical protein
MPSKRVPPPLPSPSVYDSYEGGQLGMTTVVEAGKAKLVDVERGAGEARRKTLFQRALEGWWDLPGLLSRGDTIRGKTRPFPQANRKERGFQEDGFV